MRLRKQAKYFSAHMLLELLIQFTCRPTRFLKLSKAGLDLNACNRKTIRVGSNKPSFFSKYTSILPAWHTAIWQGSKLSPLPPPNIYCLRLISSNFSSKYLESAVGSSFFFFPLETQRKLVLSPPCTDRQNETSF